MPSFSPPAEAVARSPSRFPRHRGKICGEFAPRKSCCSIVESEYVTPCDRGAHRLQPFRQITRTVTQFIEAAIKSRQNVDRSRVSHPTCDQFDRERESVQPVACFPENGCGIRFTQRKAGIEIARSRREQSNRIVTGEQFEPVMPGRVEYRQRSDRERPLTAVGPCSTRREDTQPGGKSSSPAISRTASITVSALSSTSRGVPETRLPRRLSPAAVCHLKTHHGCRKRELSRGRAVQDREEKRHSRTPTRTPSRATSRPATKASAVLPTPPGPVSVAEAGWFRLGTTIRFRQLGPYVPDQFGQREKPGTGRNRSSTTACSDGRVAAGTLSFSNGARSPRLVPIRTARVRRRDRARTVCGRHPAAVHPLSARRSRTMNLFVGRLGLKQHAWSDSR